MHLTPARSVDLLWSIYRHFARIPTYYALFSATLLIVQQYFLEWKFDSVNKSATKTIGDNYTQEPLTQV